ncbi:hypothetical protein [Synechococcus phage S-H9-2]|uniref:Uncharacterized protein n=1 Tax=Synechococcus phage S-H9-2 TaxID=2783669 RepID=A0A873WKW6_9CAUD|nr:hypothetical protein PQC10_gp024 [Synechococcus phage S-H9-2]QPB08301.1 hypothetical protein [Synechococcus phage S-H9-2]
MSSLNVTNVNATNVNADNVDIENLETTITLTNYTDSTRPATPSVGTIIWNSDAGEVQVWNGDAWTNISKASATEIPVTQGLLVNLDAGNRNSYSGSGGTWFDLSGRGQDGAITNATWSTFGGGSFDFAGNAYVDLGASLIGSGGTLIGTGDNGSSYTLMAFVNVRSSSGTTTNAASIVGSRSTYGVGMQVGESGGNARVNYGARGTSNYYGNTFAYNTWRHIALSRIGGTSVRSYENGQFVASTAATNLEAASGQSYDNMRIGYSAPRISGYFNGYIAMVQIYNRGLSESEIQLVYDTFKDRYGL